MSRVILQVITICAFNFSYAFSNSIHYLQELSSLWDQLDERALVVFDVDEVLITTEDHFGHPYAKYIFFPLLIRHLWNAKTLEEKEEIENIMSLTYFLPKKLLIEEESPKLIKRLQDNGVTVIALTHFPIDKMGQIADASSWLINVLKSFHFNFTCLDENKVFLEMESEKKYLPLMQSGIVFAKGSEKGDVLKSLFKQCNFYPAKVIFIDDLYRHVESVQVAMESLGIECHSYQYLGANRFFKSRVDMDILNYQIDELLKNKNWMSDKEVQKKITGG